MKSVIQLLELESSVTTLSSSLPPTPPSTSKITSSPKTENKNNNNNSNSNSNITTLTTPKAVYTHYATLYISYLSILRNLEGISKEKKEI